MLQWPHTSSPCFNSCSSSHCILGPPWDLPWGSSHYPAKSPQGSSWPTSCPSLLLQSYLLPETLFLLHFVTGLAFFIFLLTLIRLLPVSGPVYSLFPLFHWGYFLSLRCLLKCPLFWVTCSDSHLKEAIVTPYYSPCFYITYLLLIFSWVFFVSLLTISPDWLRHKLWVHSCTRCRLLGAFSCSIFQFSVVLLYCFNIFIKYIKNFS